MNEHNGKPDEPLLDPLTLPPDGGQAALDEVERLKSQPAHFNCLGLGCLPWLVIIAIAVALWFVLR
jgi:hypothetical protein